MAIRFNSPNVFSVPRSRKRSSPRDTSMVSVLQMPASASNLSGSCLVLERIHSSMGSRWGLSLAWLLIPTATITWWTPSTAIWQL